MTVRYGSKGGRKSRGHVATAPVLAYYGSKNRLSKRIVASLVEHTTYVEPFFGSGAVLFAKRPSRTEVVNDVDGELVNFFRVLRDHPAELGDLLDFTPYARDEYVEDRDGDLQNLNELERARRFFVSCNAAYSGVGGDSTDAGFSYSNGTNQSRAALFRNRTRRFRQVAYRLRNVEIENTDALRLFDRLDSPTTSFYLDPPYLASTRTVNRGYGYDSAGQQFHTELLAACLEVQGQVLLSGYASDLYDKALNSWHRYEVAVKTSAGDSSDRTEVVWANRLPR